MSHLNRFQTALENAGYDAAIISEGNNEHYLSGFHFDDGLILVTKKKSYLLTDFRYAEAARAQANPELEVLTPAGGGMLAAIKTLLQANDCKTVSTEDQTLSCADFRRYEDVLTGFRLTGGASALLAALRLCKDDAELETIARAQAITDAAFSHILTWLHPDATEVEVALELEYFMRRNGAEAVAFDTIAVSGTNSSRPHGVPRYKKLEKGFLTMDFGALYNGYCSDMTRTVCIGRADDEMKRLYQTVLDAQLAAIDFIAPGVKCADCDKVARDIIDGAGYKGCFGHSLGHGVGMFIHESPRLSSGAGDKVLGKGHVVTVEPGIYLEGKYGVRIEDMMYIGDTDATRITNCPKQLIEL